MTSIHDRIPFRFGEIGGDTAPPEREAFRTTFRTAQANYLYIMRQDGDDELGRTPNFSAKIADLVDHGRETPLRGPLAALAGVELWKAMDRAARLHCPQDAVAFHMIGTLPANGDKASWRALIQSFARSRFCDNGMIVDWAIHALADEGGEWVTVPHVHFVVTARSWRTGSGRRFGLRNRAWFGGGLSRRELVRCWSDLTGIYPAIAH